jgi:pyruvate dehydrogenase E1 component
LRATPLITAVDGHSHTPAFLAAINQGPACSLGATWFGQSGSLEDVCRYHGIAVSGIVRVAVDVRSS